MRRRVVFLGDSFVQGVGDPEHRGWAGRVLQAAGGDVTGFNLGVRRNTSDDVLRRCWPEVDARVVPDEDNRIVVSFGSNDMVAENGAVRVAAERCAANLASLLDGSAHRGIPVLVVGPPPVADAGEAHLRRTARLAAVMAELCAARNVPFVATTEALAADPVWTSEALAGDGAHPGAGGYQRLAELVLAGAWPGWLGG
ncbi:GDSL-type esterase/lipase family protein [Amycolatopsis sp. NPDC051903]|uniref:GDSL-type esterase/lipase family protein n=1 Tax=Amycolatopsis sp. NPDC051903 TaxID=3363936 RepID=UPI0037953969